MPRSQGLTEVYSHFTQKVIVNTEKNNDNNQELQKVIV
jgi:hypothetical protein